MASAEDVLAENLKEALKQAHRHIVFATSAALFLLLLVAGQWDAAATKQVRVPLIDADVEGGLARIVVSVAYFVSGCLANLAVWRARKIMWRLRNSPSLREAVLTYPSIPTITRTGFRITALLFPIMLFFAATLPFVSVLPRNSAQGLVFTVVLLSVPYLALIALLWYPLGTTKYELTDKSLAKLAELKVPKQTLDKLKPLVNQEFPNLDRFLEALKGTAGQIEPATHVTLIQVWASEEAVFED